MNQTTETLFKLIRVAIGNEDDIAFSCSVNWQDVYGMSMKQGVGAIACDGLLSLNECDIDEELRYKWMGQSLVIEKKYAKQKQSIESLVAFYQRHGIRVMVLKGYGLSLNYPVPQHRPAGDIDIILFVNIISITFYNFKWNFNIYLSINKICYRNKFFIRYRLQLKATSI